MSEPLFLGYWEGHHATDSMKAMVSDFSTTMEEVEPYRILLAHYDSEGYMGDAFVLMERDGNLYEVNGSHCSCHGLEGQWEPELTFVEALRRRLEGGGLGTDHQDRNTFAEELTEILTNFSN